MSVRLARKIGRNELRPYRKKGEYLNELGEVLRKDYGMQSSEEDLLEIGRNMDVFLDVFC